MESNLLQKEALIEELIKKGHISLREAMTLMEKDNSYYPMYPISPLPISPANPNAYPNYPSYPSPLHPTIMYGNHPTNFA